jgi:hypothetical protein
MIIRLNSFKHFYWNIFFSNKSQESQCGAKLYTQKMIPVQVCWLSFFCSLVKQFLFMNLSFIWRSFAIDAGFSFRKVSDDDGGGGGGGGGDGGDELLYSCILCGEVPSLHDKF